MKFKEFCARRRLAASRKYILENGENEANYRDSLLDILEELADAVHITQLTVEKVAKYNPEYTKVVISYAGNILKDLDAIADEVFELRAVLPEIYSEDRVEVDRHARLNES